MAPNLSAKQWALSHLILALVLALVLHQFFQIHNAKASITFLNVGQGDAILIQTEDHKNILIDTGPDGKVVEELSEHLNFFNQKLDLFIITHPDLDHYGGALDLLQKYPVDQIMLTGISSKSQLYKALLQEIIVQKIPVIYPRQSQDWQISAKLFLDILYPFEQQSLLGQEVKNKNDTSISMVLRNSEGKGLALLTGDGEEKQEIDLLLSAQDLSANIFKLGHHGSKTSSSVGMLSAANAKNFVASAGRDNKFGHPHPEVLERLAKDAKVFHTHEGAVSFELW